MRFALILTLALLVCGDEAVSTRGMPDGGAELSPWLSSAAAEWEQAKVKELK